MALATAGQTAPAVNIYYTPPPGQSPNVFSSFWGEFLKMRLPLAKQILSQRLAAMSPQDFSAEIAALREMEQKHRAKLMDIAQRAQASGDDRDIALRKLISAESIADANNSQRNSEARFKGEVTLFQAGQLEQTKQQPIMDSARAGVTQAIAQGNEAGSAAALRKAMTLFRDTNPKPGERAAFVRQMTDLMQASGAGVQFKESTAQVLGELAKEHGSASPAPSAPVSPGAASARVTGSGAAPAGAPAAPGAALPSIEDDPFLQSIQDDIDRLKGAQGKPGFTGDLFEPFRTAPAGLSFLQAFQDNAVATVPFQLGVERAQQLAAPRRLERRGEALQQAVSQVETEAEVEKLRAPPTFVEDTQPAKTQEELSPVEQAIQFKDLLAEPDPSELPQIAEALPGEHPLIEQALEFARRRREAEARQRAAMQAR